MVAAPAMAATAPMTRSIQTVRASARSGPADSAPSADTHTARTTPLANMDSAASKPAHAAGRHGRTRARRAARKGVAAGLYRAKVVVVISRAALVIRRGRWGRK